MKSDFILEFFEVARRFRDSVAIEERGLHEVTYSQLENAARIVAHNLRAENKEDFVAIRMSRSAEYVATLLGVWAAGKVAVIMDPDWPDQRTNYVLDSASPGKILRQGDTACPSEQYQPDAFLSQVEVEPTSTSGRK